ncbi:hypothetical protein D9758_018740 [Tetrapyrgos nigripes]|uniref:Uncharacterized protein n=1 Tax=Tetrapyrgos nigripes TaxID=182062 RepID=A0A8H5AZ29_9AGAR|nr:hypothetical protein D9758_018740 [Tetrapyrgos nigripes]
MDDFCTSLINLLLQNQLSSRLASPLASSSISNFLPKQLQETSGDQGGRKDDGMAGNGEMVGNAVTGDLSGKAQEGSWDFGASFRPTSNGHRQVDVDGQGPLYRNTQLASNRRGALVLAPDSGSLFPFPLSGATSFNATPPQSFDAKAYRFPALYNVLVYNQILRLRSKILSESKVSAFLLSSSLSRSTATRPSKDIPPDIDVKSTSQLPFNPPSSGLSTSTIFAVRPSSSSIHLARTFCI